MVSGKTLPRRTPSRRKAALVSLVYNYATFGFFIVQALILVPFYLTHAGQSLYGAWLATGNVVAYFASFEFGVSSVVGQRAAKHHGAGDDLQVRRSIGTGLAVLAVLALLPMLLGLPLAVLLPRFIGVTGADSDQVIEAFRIASIATGTMLFVQGLQNILFGLQRQLVASILLLGANILGIFTTVVLFLRGHGIVSFGYGALVRSAGPLVGMAAYLWRVLKNEGIGFPLLGRSEFRVLSKQSVWMFLSNITGQQADNLVVASVWDPSQATLLNNTRKAADVVAMLGRQLANSLMPGIAHLSGTGDQTRLRSICLSLLRAGLFVGLLGMGCYVILNREFVTLWVGFGFYGGDLANILAAFAGLTLLLSGVLAVSLYSLGDIIVLAKVMILDGILKTGVSIVFCRYWGFRGVLLAAGVVSLAITLPLQVVLYSRRLELRPQAVFRLILATAGKGCIAIGALWLAIRMNPILKIPTNPIGFLIGAFVCVVLLGTVLWGIDPGIRGAARDVWASRIGPRKA